jgi:hypothetical protein
MYEAPSERKKIFAQTCESVRSTGQATKQHTRCYWELVRIFQAAGKHDLVAWCIPIPHDLVPPYHNLVQLCTYTCILSKLTQHVPRALAVLMIEYFC